MQDRSRQESIVNESEGGEGGKVTNRTVWCPSRDLDFKKHNKQTKTLPPTIRAHLPFRSPHRGEILPSMPHGVGGGGTVRAVCAVEWSPCRTPWALLTPPSRSLLSSQVWGSSTCHGISLSNLYLWLSLFSTKVILIFFKFFPPFFNFLFFLLSPPNTYFLK